MTIRIDRRQFLMGSSALVAAGAAGVMPAWAQASNLRLIFWGGQAFFFIYYGLTEIYTKTKGTAVEGEFLAWNDYWPKLATQTAGGNAPDIIQMDYRYIVEYAKRNAIAPLDEFVGGALKLDGFDASCFDGVYVTGDINADDIARINEARIGQEDPQLEEDTSRLALPNAQDA